MNIIKRPRRLRKSQGIRDLICERRLAVNDLVYPLFVVEGAGIKSEIPSMPGVYHFSIDRLLLEIEQTASLGIKGIILFGVTEKKDGQASEAYNPEGLVQRAVRAVKREFPQMVVFTDVCLCEYMDHGHCGIVGEGTILNDPSLDLLAKTALSHAQAGADFVAPSDMMDGRVAAIRGMLDNEGRSDTGIMSYAVKYSSAFYGPFREAAGSAPSFGDRKTYQMNPANRREAIREAKLDIEEGADIIMVKPAIHYLDVLKGLRSAFDSPLAAYHVSGEYSQIKAAARLGWIDEEQAIMEASLAIKRAGADLIITYFAKDIAYFLRNNEK